MIEIPFRFEEHALAEIIMIDKDKNPITFNHRRWGRNVFDIDDAWARNI